mmetsp:Transcript_4567/g.11137  ORF Transcript_4567/g.11137 Transcript_4567/m.11137 type:complete len:463 (-) Transcript_4567:1479-2867(-)
MEQRLNELRAELGKSSSNHASSNTAPSGATFPITVHSNAAPHNAEAATPSLGNSGAQLYGYQDGQRTAMRTGTGFSGTEPPVIENPTPVRNLFAPGRQHFDAGAAQTYPRHAEGPLRGVGQSLSRTVEESYHGAGQSMSRIAEESYQVTMFNPPAPPPVTSGFGGYSSTMMAPKPAPQNQSEVIDLDYSELPLAFSPAKPAKPGSFALAGRAKKVVNQSFHWKKRCPWTDELHNANRNVFGNLSFRSQQEEAINAVMSGKDVFVLMPTGGGKSLCYQLPSILGDGVTVVVSPLVSLIQDQVQHLRKLGINAAAMVASQTADERSEVMSDLRSMNPQTRLVYVTPEKVSRSPAFFSVLQRLYDNRKLARIAIDEAHCVSQWGHDFRPDYKELSIFRRRFPNTPVMALTATATPEVQNDVLLQLGLKPAPSSIMFVQSFNRSNLIYEVRQKTKKQRGQEHRRGD